MVFPQPCTRRKKTSIVKCLPTTFCKLHHYIEMFLLNKSFNISYNIAMVTASQNHNLCYTLLGFLFCKLAYFYFLKLNNEDHNFAYWVILHAFLSSAVVFFFKIFFTNNYFMNTIKVSNSLYPDQANILLGLIWVQTLCKGYQQTIEGNKLIKINKRILDRSPESWVLINQSIKLYSLSYMKCVKHHISTYK